MLAGAGAFRWIGNAARLLLVLIVIGVRPTLAILAVAALIGFVWRIVEWRVYGEFA